MSGLAFKYFCCECFQALPRSSGLVLSCGDFLCNRCSQSIGDGRCPACREQIQHASLNNAPEEIVKTLEDPSDSLEAMYNLLKFQLTHYKTMLDRAAGKIAACQRQLYDANENCASLRNELSSLKRGNNNAVPETFETRESFSSRGTKRTGSFQSNGDNITRSLDNTGGLTWQSGQSRDSVVIQPQQTRPSQSLNESGGKYSREIVSTTGGLLHPYGSESPSSSTYTSRLHTPNSLNRGSVSTVSQLPPMRPLSQQQTLQRISTPNSINVYGRPGSGQSLSSGPARIRSPHTPVVAQRSPYFAASPGNKSVTVTRS